MIAAIESIGSIVVFAVGVLVLVNIAMFVWDRLL